MRGTVPIGHGEDLYDHAIVTTRTVDPSLALPTATAATRRGPLSERQHHDTLRQLWINSGPQAVLDAGFEIGRHGSGELLEVLATSADVLQLMHRFARLQPMLHMGHRCVVATEPGVATLTHGALTGDVPHPADSVFVCGSSVGMALRIGVDDLAVSMFGSDGVVVSVWPEPSVEGLRQLAGPCRWTLRWHASPTPPVSPTVDVLRAEIVNSPERCWTLATCAAAMRTSPRTLQRRISEAGTTVQRTIIDSRLDAASGWLLRTDASATAIAHICGFSDLAHLSREVRRRHGVSPGRLRVRKAERMGVRDIARIDRRHFSVAQTKIGALNLFP